MGRDEGKAEALEGKIEQVAGDLAYHPALYDEGVVDEATGNTQNAAGPGRRIVGTAAAAIGKEVQKKQSQNVARRTS